MNTTKPAHTPGPWRYEASTKTIRSVPTNYWLATMDSWDGAVNHEANALLIASAPDLLEIARLFREGCVRGEAVGEVFFSALLDKVDAAIAKSEGGK